MEKKKLSKSAIISISLSGAAFVIAALLLIFLWIVPTVKENKITKIDTITVGMSYKKVCKIFGKEGTFEHTSQTREEWEETRTNFNESPPYDKPYEEYISDNFNGVDIGGSDMYSWVVNRDGNEFIYCCYFRNNSLVHIRRYSINRTY
jgi:hypothetical protein